MCGVLCLMVRDSYRLRDAHSLSMVSLFGIMSPTTCFCQAPVCVDIYLRRFLKKNVLIQDVSAGWIKMSYLGNAGWRSKRASTACIAALPSAMPFW
jgi:hypothetical protein